MSAVIDNYSNNVKTISRCKSKSDSINTLVNFTGNELKTVRYNNNEGKIVSLITGSSDFFIIHHEIKNNLSDIGDLTPETVFDYGLLIGSINKDIAKHIYNAHISIAKDNKLKAI